MKICLSFLKRLKFKWDRIINYLLGFVTNNRFVMYFLLSWIGFGMVAWFFGVSSSEFWSFWVCVYWITGSGFFQYWRMLRRHSIFNWPTLSWHYFRVHVIPDWFNLFVITFLTK